ncbi:type II secretion system minor pseudopilin GspI [Marinimicrobium sp. ARAG 43.8]|uniref:type II secretion system minor pseudopilin GspI n=1 Tax=Marinimicrobium sp. ARAG 43.8 TaxID=3418719 RepID=UPI003CF98384
MSRQRFIQPLQRGAQSLQRGFTLIEVMVALVVVAVALPAFLTLVMTQLDGAAAIRDKTLAFWVAENEMTKLRLRRREVQDFTLPDQEQGEVTLAGMEWQWRLTNGPLEIGEYGEMAEFREIDIEVSPLSQPDNILATLSGVFQDDP